ncbi:cytochrome c biogenesis CcdA family protein [Clostridium folliculivorans]|uniref:Cytochrome C biogenesis protein CcdA n=1 Tax=Clostridium folliculivorans TaxID=2886038 RepID=A0A9W6D8N4_9CLOT|nr:cytochrome c biogenesis protein CcdA [Clostridium folliculivorans]GKU23236.1 cytochrome C biogenesis protein CcdA [Clostridium folliculivorans]GKU29353.1 cytochrome C biogenesis protein CcdA [Clostridium folliculivorans]
MNEVPFFLAFSAGLLSFLSPCVLPLVPAYIGYMTGSSMNNKSVHRYKITNLYKVLGFVLGFSVIFIIMGASATTLGKLIIKNQILFRKIGGSLMIVFGLHTMGIIKIKMLYHEKRLLSIINFSENFSPILIGMAFAAGWTPCVGPILSSILIYSSNLTTVYQGIFLLSIYSLGLSIPFILTAMAIDSFIKFKNNVLKFSKFISIISGLLLVIMGILVFTNNLNTLSRYVNFINF